MFVWMASVGISPSRISNFTQLLVQDEIDQEVLEILTLEQLEKLGIPMGPRSLIFNAAQSGEHDSLDMGGGGGGGTDLSDSLNMEKASNKINGFLFFPLFIIVMCVCVTTGIDVCKFGSTCGLAESSFQCSCVNGTSGPLCETGKQFILKT